MVIKQVPVAIGDAQTVSPRQRSMDDRLTEGETKSYYYTYGDA